jgi:hypothetical protein
MADAAEVPGLAWSRSEMTSRSPTIGGAEPSFITSLSFAVTREELERRWVEHSPNAKVPDSGLIRRFRSAIELYQLCHIDLYQLCRMIGPNCGARGSSLRPWTFPCPDNTWVSISPNGTNAYAGIISVPNIGTLNFDLRGMPDYRPSTETGQDVIQPGKIHIEFQEESRKPWGQQHDFTVMAEEVFKRKRYAIIDRALQHLKLQCRRAAIQADLDELKFVQVRFLHG